MSAQKFGRVGRGARLAIGLQVVLAGVLALAALLMVNWLVGRPGVRVRLDLTAKQRNSLDPATELVMESLQEPVTVDVFFRPLREPLTALAQQVQQRTFKLLALMDAVAGDNLEVVVHNLADRAAVEERLRELHIRGLENCLIVSQGHAREVVTLRGDLAEIDLGNPDPNAFKPPSILSFDAERAIVEALLKVTRGERPRVLFLSGHGEPPLLEVDEGSLGRLHSSLQEDGLLPESWNRLEEGPFPEDTAAIVVAGPTDPLSDDLLDELEAYVRGGGRLLLAPAAEAEALERSRAGELAERFGLEIGSGTVLQAWQDPVTKRFFGGQRALVFESLSSQMRRHPVLDDLRVMERSFLLSRVHPVRVASQVTGGQGVSTPLLGSDPNTSWLDAPPLDLEHDEATEPARSFDLMAASQFVPEAVLEAERTQASDGSPTQRTEARLLVLGSVDLMRNVYHAQNRDFSLAAINWLVDREWRVAVSPKDPDRRVLPEERQTPVIHLALWILPGLALLGGLFTTLVRARGGAPRA